MSRSLFSRPIRLFFLVFAFVFVLFFTSGYLRELQPSLASQFPAIANSDKKTSDVEIDKSADFIEALASTSNKPSSLNIAADRPASSSLLPSSSSMSTTAFSLPKELEDKRALVLDRLRKPETQDASAPIVLIMGNEAGDTDSLASAVLLSHLLTQSTESQYAKKFAKSTVFAPLVQQHRSDLPLRAENQLLLSMLRLSPEQLLFLDDLPSTNDLAKRTDVQLGLVDHPKLSSYWQPYEQFDDKVSIIVDHHADDGAHKNAAIRILRGPENGAIASDVSVVVDMFKDDPYLKQLPAPIADLSLAAVLIDTDDLRPLPNGKATEVDLASAQILSQRSSLASPATAAFVQSNIDTSDPDLQANDQSLGGEQGKVSGGSASSLSSPTDLRATTSQFFQVLSQKKLDVSRLNTRDLLRRDYKENVVELADGQTAVRAGFSSVPVGLSDWIHQRHGDGDDRWASYWKAIGDWMGERSLDVAVVGTSFRDWDEKEKIEERAKNGKHRRELILAYLHRTNAKVNRDNLFSDVKLKLEVDEYATSLGGDVNLQLILEQPWKGRRSASTGKRERLEAVSKDGLCQSASQRDAEVWIAVWRQQNARASRKVYLPAVVHALQSAATRHRKL